MQQMITGPEQTLRVLLVDDQQLVRSGFALILSVEDDIDVVGSVADGAQAVEAARRLRPDVILMDVQMPVLDGIAATAQITEEDLSKVIILTTFDRDDYLFDALQAGASGFLLKNADPEHLVDAVRAVGQGHALLAPEVTRRVIARMTARADDGPRIPIQLSHAMSPAGRRVSLSGASGQPDPGDAARHGSADRLSLLTDREREVLRLVARGMSNAEIATTLFLGEATVKTHVSNCLAKLRVRDRVQAVVVAYQGGLVRS
ncbi:Response regulator protein VraR [Austwickia sp. TVS 96-490-7B]|nr:Response regulator protein VraR [Austwickia sp. TVS 96-490-7B]